MSPSGKPGPNPAQAPGAGRTPPRWRQAAALLLATAGCAALSPAMAQTATGAGAAPAAVIDVERALALALAHAPELAAPRHWAAGAAAAARTAALVEAPVLKLSTDRDSGAAAAAARTKVGIEWSPPAWGETALRGRALSHAAQLQAAALEQARHRLAAEVRRLHAELDVLQQRRQLAREQRETRDALVVAGAAQLAVARRTRAAQLELQLQAAAAASAENQRETEWRRARTRMAALLGLPADAPWSLPPPSGAWVLTPATTRGDAGGERHAPGPETVAQALASRPDAAAQRQRCAALAADAERQRQADRRWLKSVELNHAPSRAGKPAQWGVAVDIALPVVGDRQGDDTAAGAAVAACEADAAALHASIAEQLAQAHQLRALAADEAHRQWRTVLPLQRSALALAQAARTSGRSDETEWLAARAAAADARDQALQRLLALRLAELALQEAMGQSLPAAP